MTENSASHLKPAINEERCRPGVVAAKRLRLSFGRCGIGILLAQWSIPTAAESVMMTSNVYRHDGIEQGVGRACQAG
jgi:hypothetical protein